MSSGLIYIGHRGTRTHYDENTIEAFKGAIDSGARCIEFDVRKTKDGKLLVMHDSSLDRTTNGSGLIKEYYYNEIKNFRTKNHHCVIPLLSEVLEELKGKVQFMIELKDEDLVNEILKIVKEANIFEDCIFSGRNLNDLIEIKERYSNFDICYNITKGSGFRINDFLKFGNLKQLKYKPDLISLRSNLISIEFIKICHENDIKSLAWDFISYHDPILKIKTLIDLGIDGILFDDHRNIKKIRRWINKT